MCRLLLNGPNLTPLHTDIETGGPVFESVVGGFKAVHIVLYLYTKASADCSRLASYNADDCWMFELNQGNVTYMCQTQEWDVTLLDFLSSYWDAN